MEINKGEISAPKARFEDAFDMHLPIRCTTNSVSQGLWYARSPAIVHSSVMETLVWLRVPRDVVFAAGAVLLALYALRLLGRPAVPALATDRAVQRAVRRA
jgi:hypothetical protein